MWSVVALMALCVRALLLPVQLAVCGWGCAIFDRNLDVDLSRFNRGDIDFFEIYTKTLQK